MSSILIIDDDPNNRQILRDRLELKGHTVLEAPDGEQGLRLAEENIPDLVILDAMMPKMDGWQVCRQIKARPKIRAVAVIMLTARDKQIDQLRGWESGADEYVGKPWDPAKLLVLVDKWCHAAKARGLETGRPL